jgi:hypothetical protein
VGLGRWGNWGHGDVVRVESASALRPPLVSRQHVGLPGRMLVTASGHGAGQELWQARAEDLQEAASGQGGYVLWLLLNERSYPHAAAVRRVLVGDWRGLLCSEWIARGFPLMDLSYYLSRPRSLPVQRQAVGNDASLDPVRARTQDGQPSGTDPRPSATPSTWSTPAPASRCES